MSGLQGDIKWDLMTTWKTFHLFSICCGFKTKNVQTFHHFPRLDLLFADFSQLHKFPLQILRLFSRIQDSVRTLFVIMLHHSKTQLIQLQKESLLACYSSVVRALHRYRRGQGSVFRLSLDNRNTWVFNWADLVCFYFFIPQFQYMKFIYSFMLNS